MMYHNPQAVVQVNRRRSRALGLPLSPLLYVLALVPLLHRLRDKGTNLALRGVPFAGPLTAGVSTFPDDIAVFVSRRLDIKAVKEAVGKYERIAEAMVNFEGLWLGAWRGVTDPSAFSGCGSGLTSNWSEISQKYKLR